MAKSFNETPAIDPDRRRMNAAEHAAAGILEDAFLGSGPQTEIVAGDGVRAGYKIELTFGPNRSALKEYNALILLWESGKHFHGGGDGNMFYCLDCRYVEKLEQTKGTAWKYLQHLLKTKEPGEYGCGHPIPGGAVMGPFGFCRNCNAQVSSTNLTGQFPFYGTTQELAELVSRLFDTLKANADIYCKYHPTDIRYKQMEEFKGVETARRLKGMFIYPLHRILKDVSAGATLQSRFAAFFNA